jgi:hypothetical protein
MVSTIGKTQTNGETTAFFEFITFPKTRLPCTQAFEQINTFESAMLSCQKAHSSQQK